MTTSTDWRCVLGRDFVLGGEMALSAGVSSVLVCVLSVMVCVCVSVLVCAII